MATSSLFTDRIATILDVTGDDSTALNLIASVRTSLLRYKETIINYERLGVLRLRCFDEAEVKELTVRLDTQKHTAHERLMSDIAIVNRYLFKTYGRSIPAGGVYTDDPHHLYGGMNRHAIEAWACRQPVMSLC